MDGFSCKYRFFLKTIIQTENAIQKQANVELALRFFAFRKIPYQRGLDVHEYLNKAVRELAKNELFSMEREGDIFNRTFSLISNALGTDAFKKWDGNRFLGKFLISVFEVLATGISKNIDAIEQLPPTEQNEFIINKAKTLWDNTVFLQYTGAGVSGSARLANLIPLAETFLRP